MTSNSILGSTTIVIQFDLNRNIDAAARDVQAAINAARSQLPANLPSNPFYRKVNPADAPILLLALTSDLVERARMYDLASSILAQKLSQVKGVGQVNVGGGALPAVRVDINPTVLNKYGLDLGRCSRDACEREHQPSQGRGSEPATFLGREHHRSTVESRRIPAIDHSLSRGQRAAAFGCRDGNRLG